MQFRLPRGANGWVAAPQKDLSYLCAARVSLSLLWVWVLVVVVIWASRCTKFGQPLEVSRWFELIHLFLAHDGTPYGRGLFRVLVSKTPVAKFFCFILLHSLHLQSLTGNAWAISEPPPPHTRMLDLDLHREPLKVILYCKYLPFCFPCDNKYTGSLLSLQQAPCVSISVLWTVPFDFILNSKHFLLISDNDSTKQQVLSLVHKVCK